MATYIILNAVFLVLVLVALRVRPAKPSRTWTIMFAVLLLLTVTFDSLLIAAQIVAYDENKILGIRLGLAPIEDFFYALLAAIIVPTLWKRLEKN